MTLYITIVCEMCGCETKVRLIDNKAFFLVHDELIGWDELIGSFGNLNCLDCKSESNVKFEVNK